jgi:uncharacterized membrane protein
MASQDLRRPRIQSIDLLRGVAMIIMALDHTRGMLHSSETTGNDPLDFATTTPLLFLTRWITHFCAPVFVFLAGASVFFSSVKKSKKEISSFLLTRGLWLMLLEVTVVYFAWENYFYYAYLMLQVIWAIGLSMVMLSALIYLPKRILFVIGLLLVFGHNLLDRVDFVKNSIGGFIWSVMHVPHEFKLDNSHIIDVAYPVIPWLGLMILGFIFGELYKKDVDPKQRKKILIQLGTSSILLFILLRSGNFYGDAHHWQHQSTSVFTILSFVDTVKYPPSLLFILMTIGPALIFLAFTEKWKNKFLGYIVVFGRVPLFYYVLHLYLIHTITWILFFATGHSWSELDFINRAGGFPKGFGFHLWQIYIIWIIVVLLLYLPCKWYNNYKSTHHYWWLSYI